MSPVVLTLCRESMGSGTKRYTVDLFRSRDFFPDKLLTDSALRSDKDKDRGSIGSSSSSMRASDRDRMSIQPKITGSGSYKPAFASSNNVATPPRPAKSNSLSPTVPPPLHFLLSALHSQPRLDMKADLVHRQGISPPPKPDETGSSGYRAMPTLDDPLRPSRARASMGGEGRVETESERTRMLEGRVIDLTLDLERARDALEMERQRSLESLAKQATELRKERETNESVGTTLPHDIILHRMRVEIARWAVHCMPL